MDMLDSAMVTRRQFLGKSAGATAGFASWVAMEWAQDQVARALKGQLKVG